MSFYQELLENVIIELLHSIPNILSTEKHKGEKPDLLS